MPEPDSVLPEELPQSASGFALPDFCGSQQFRNGIMIYVRTVVNRNRKLQFLLNALRGRCDEEIPEIRDLIDFTVEDAYTGTLETANEAMIGKSEAQWAGYLCRTALYQLLGYIDHLQAIHDATHPPTENASEIPRAPKGYEIMRFDDSVGRSSDGTGNGLTIGDLAEDNHKVTPYSAMVVDQLNSQMRQFLSDCFAKCPPHMNEFFELMTGLDDDCWNEDEFDAATKQRNYRPPKFAYAGRQAAKILDERHPETTHAGSTYQRHFLDIKREFEKHFNIELHTTPRGPQADKSDHRRGTA